METAEIIKRNKNGKFKLQETNNRSFLIAFFARKQNARMPKRAFIGAGAIAIVKGRITIAQYIILFNIFIVLFFINILLLKAVS